MRKHVALGDNSPWVSLEILQAKALTTFVLDYLFEEAWQPTAIEGCPLCERAGVLTAHCHQSFGFPKLRLPPLKSTPPSAPMSPSVFAQGNQGKRGAHATSCAMTSRDLLSLTQESGVFCQHPGKGASKPLCCKQGTISDPHRS